MWLRLLLLNRQGLQLVYCKKKNWSTATFLQLLQICGYFVLACCDVLLRDTVAAHHQVLSYGNLAKLANSMSLALQNFVAVKNSIAEISAPFPSLQTLPVAAAARGSSDPNSVPL